MDNGIVPAATEEFLAFTKSLNSLFGLPFPFVPRHGPFEKVSKSSRFQIAIVDSAGQ
jgi:hypothetical protein